LEFLAPPLSRPNGVRPQKGRQLSSNLGIPSVFAYMLHKTPTLCLLACPKATTPIQIFDLRGDHTNAMESILRLITTYLDLIRPSYSVALSFVTSAPLSNGPAIPFVPRKGVPGTAKHARHHILSHSYREWLLFVVSVDSGTTCKILQMILRCLPLPNLSFHVLMYVMMNARATICARAYDNLIT
jgi:hypothetical protein